MKRYLFLLLIIVLVGCAQKNSDAATIYRELGACSHEWFSQKLHSKYPNAKMILCDDRSLIFQMESMWASREYRLVDFTNNNVYYIEFWEMGSICTDDDGCETVTRDECKNDKSCTPGTLFQMSRNISAADGGSRLIAQWTNSSASIVTVTMQDWKQTLSVMRTRDLQRSCSIFFHVDEIQHSLSSEYCD